MLRRCVPFLRCVEWIGCLHGIKFHTGPARILFSSYDKDLPNPNLPTPVNKLYSADTDILMDQLRKARSIDNILELTSNHLDVMNAKHIVVCLESVHKFSRQENFDSPSLIDHDIFQAMSSKLMKIIRLLDSGELIKVYKTMSGLGIRNNTYVMQSVLKMIGGHLNDMSLRQLVFLNFLLSKQRHNSMVDGLRLAIPLALQVQIEQQLDSDNITEVVDCLQLACRSRLKPATIQKILDVVLDKAKLLSPSNATTVIFALLNIDTPLDGYKKLLNYSFDILSKNIELFDPKKVIHVLRISSTQNAYHSLFYFAAADKASKEKWNLDSTWEIMKCFNKLNFCPSNIMDHFVASIRLESNEFRTSPVYSVLNCVEYLTASGYHPLNLEDTLTVICSCKDKIAALKEKPNLLIKFVSCLAMLGCFPESLFSAVLNEEFLFDAWSQSRKQGREHSFERNVLCIAWSLEVYDQQQNFTFPPTVLKSLTQFTCQKLSESSSPLEKFIENGLGGPQFLKSGVFTHDGMIIDHVVALRSGNYPVALDTHDSSVQGVHFVEDISLPPDAKIIAIIVAYQDNYCQDPEVLKGWIALKVKNLAKKKYSPVVINYSHWRDLPDREKIPSLMHEIKEAFLEDEVFKSNSFEMK